MDFARSLRISQSPGVRGLPPGRKIIAELSQRASRSRDRAKLPAPHALTA
jgi:hypothetical protein